MSRYYVEEGIRNSIFMWNEGNLYQIYECNHRIEKQEFAYIHLQKRKMKDNRKEQNNSFFIVPNYFEDGNKNPVKLIRKNKIRKVINTQWIVVKYKSFMYRLKSGNWKRQNVIIK